MLKRPQHRELNIGLKTTLRRFLERQNNQLCDTSEHLLMVMEHNEEFDSLASKLVQTEAHPARFFFFFLHKYGLLFMQAG